MDRRTLLCLAAYLPHLAEEAFTGMWRDPLIATAFRPLAAMPAQQSAYVVFQVTFVLALVMVHLASRGGRSGEAVTVALCLGLLAESHHVVRALLSASYNSGLVTSLPMPFVGALVLLLVVSPRRWAALR